MPFELIIAGYIRRDLMLNVNLRDLIAECMKYYSLALYWRETARAFDVHYWDTQGVIYWLGTNFWKWKEDKWAGKY